MQSSENCISFLTIIIHFILWLLLQVTFDLKEGGVNNPIWGSNAPGTLGFWWETGLSSPLWGTDGCIVPELAPSGDQGLLVLNPNSQSLPSGRQLSEGGAA